ELFVVLNSSDAAGRKTINGSELGNFRLVLPRRGNLFRTILDREFHSYGIILKPALELDSLECIYQVASEPGWASITIPRNPEKLESEWGAKFIELRSPVVRRLVFLVWKSGDATAVTRLLVDRLRHYVSQQARHGE